jgi:4-amino-4-deoxy-L-arabinose transferase-like glycosyltransferase
MLIAIGLHFYGLDQEGWANQYYAAAVRSMLTSPYNFFFASFDPGGFVTVDKPPLGLWIQAISAMVFGYSGWSLLFPQALCGVLSVALTYHLVKRVFGAPAGLVAALVLALTPINIAANRNNTMDSTLVFVLLLAAWAVSLAAESGKLRWLMLCALLVGVGFNVKMLQAYLVLPAFYAVYLLMSSITWWKRILHLGLASILLAVVSLSWAVVVDLIPADQRPFIGSSHDNTVMELIVGHNGAARLFSPGRGGPGPDDGGQANQPPPDGNPNQTQPFSGPLGQPGQPPIVGQPPQGGAPGVGGPSAPNSGPGNETGDKGVFRLFNEQLGGQASWLLALAGIGFLAVVIRTPLANPLRREHQAALLWGVWLITQVAFFSVAGLFHRYYLEMMSPAIAALAGAGLVGLWNDFANGKRLGWLLPFALMVNALIEAYILSHFESWAGWIAVGVVGVSACAAIALIVWCGIGWGSTRRWAMAVLIVGVTALLVPPAIWSLTPVIGRGDSGLPYAGPELLRGGRPRTNAQQAETLITYLQSNRSDEKYLVATLNANTAAPIIIATGEPVMALGGFSGGDQILSTDELAALVAEGEVRFFLLPVQENRQTDLIRWVTGSCQSVPSSAWQSSPAIPSGPGPGGGPVQLFDCGV